jgi:hypothetical protein
VWQLTAVAVVPTHRLLSYDPSISLLLPWCCCCRTATLKPRYPHKPAKPLPPLRVEAEKRKQESAVAAFKELLQRSGLKPSNSWRKVAAKLQDEEAYEVRQGVKSDEVNAVVTGLGTLFA